MIPLGSTALSGNKELKDRLIFGIGAGIVVLLIIFWAGPELAFLVATGAAIIGWKEFCQLMGLNERPSLKYLGYIVLGLMFTHAFFVGPKTLFWLWFVWTLGFFTMYFEYAVEKRKGLPITFEIQKSWTQLCRFILGIFYLFMIFGFVGPIISKVNGEQLLTLAFIGTFGADSVAYFVGKKMGKTKVWPELSPGKSLEGWIGGWIGAILSCALLWGIFKLTMTNPISIWTCLTVGILSGPLSQGGDLMESLMKRVGHQKDSGHLLPGHGGILDRTDGLVFVLPLVYFLF